MSSAERQRVEKVADRRARLTPAPGTTDEPVIEEMPHDAAASSGGPNDERMRREVPPHY